MPLRRSARIRAMREAIRADAAAPERPAPGIRRSLQRVPTVDHEPSEAENVAIVAPQRESCSKPSGGTLSVVVASQENGGQSQGQRLPLPVSVVNPENSESPEILVTLQAGVSP